MGDALSALAPGWDWEPYVRAVAPALGLQLDPEQIVATARWLGDLAELAGPLLTDPIPDRAESAPVFQA